MVTPIFMIRLQTGVILIFRLGSIWLKFSQNSKQT